MPEVIDVYCNNEWLDAPAYLVCDPEGYRPWVEDALKVFAAFHRPSEVVYREGWNGILAEDGYEGDWLFHTEIDENGQWHGYKEFNDDDTRWCFSRVEVSRPRSNGTVQVRVVWYAKHSGNDECWANLYLPEVGDA